MSVERFHRGIGSGQVSVQQMPGTHVLRTHKNQTGHVRETSSNEVMDERSGKVQNASTNVLSFIVMNLAVVEIHHCAAVINNKASALPKKEGKCHGTFIQQGDR